MAGSMNDEVRLSDDHNEDVGTFDHSITLQSASLHSDFASFKCDAVL